MARARCALVLSFLSLVSSWAAAAGLLDAYRSAQLNDPTLRAARYERDAGLQAPAIARAGLLPNLSINSSRLQNTGDRTLTTGGPTQQLDYPSAQDVLSLRQPLFNYESFVRYRQGGVQAEYSEAVLNKKEAELAVRVAAAYFDLLLAAEKHAFANAEVTAFGEQLSLAQRRRSAGEGTLTEIAETDARLRIAEANRADAIDQMALARRTLEEMTGKPMGDLRVLRSGFAPAGVTPASVDEWSALTLERNPDIIAQRKVLESARLDVDRNRAGHLPRLDFVASASKTESETVSTLNQQANIRSVGVQLAIPLFAGFGVVAQTDQAVANRERAAAELDATVSKVRLEVHRWFLAARTGQTKVAAYTRAVDSSMVAVDGTKKGLAAGVRTNSDVLDAERVLFSTLRDRAQARYDLLVSVVKLKAAAGTLSEQDIAEIDTLLEPQGYSR